MMAKKFFRKAGLYQLTGKVNERDIFGFDTETKNKNKDFLCGSIVGDNYLFYTEDRDTMIHELSHNRIFRNSFLVATNLMFDLSVLMKDLKTMLDSFELLSRSGSIILASAYVPYVNDGKLYPKPKFLEKHDIMDGYKISLIDSTSHFPASVETLGKFIGLPKLPKPKFLGEAWSDEQEHEEIKAYNINDSTITYRYMKWLQEQYNSLGANLKVTASAVAMDKFRRTHLQGYWLQQKRDIILDSYKSYYGGRTEAFKRGEFIAENYGKVHCFDVNSLYPYCLRQFEYPTMQKCYRMAKVTGGDIDSFMGTGKFDLKAPKDMLIPIIPVNTDKLRFPVGKIAGYYDFNTIKKALDNGYELIKGSDAIVYEHRGRPFKSYIDELYSLRQRFQAEKNPAETSVKLLMNSFYGKFGYRFNNKERLMDSETANCYGGEATIIPINREISRVIADNSSHIPSYVFPIYAQYVTSYARSHMWDIFKRIGFDRVIYTDTDSVFTTRHMDTSSELGDVKLEKAFDRLLIIKPKMYGGVMDDGSTKIKIKGVHKTFGRYDEFISCISKGRFDAVTEHFTKIRGSLHGKDKYINMPYTMRKSLDLQDDKRIWEKRYITLEPQDSIPITIK